MLRRVVLLGACAVLGLAVLQVTGHGYLKDPPNRASMWRFGYDTPQCYTDNQFWCGSFQVQWMMYNGSCGECGDSYGDPRPRSNENGGTYGTGIVTKRYRAGQDISVEVEVTSNHMGWFRFSLCPLASDNALEEETCFQQHVLELADGSGPLYYVPTSNNGVFTVNLRLPAGLTCERCVMQWHYNAGNSWGVCPNGTTAVGCGNQENFRSCSDIAIDP